MSETKPKDLVRKIGRMLADAKNELVGLSGYKSSLDPKLYDTLIKTYNDFDTNRQSEVVKTLEEVKPVQRQLDAICNDYPAERSAMEQAFNRIIKEPLSPSTQTDSGSEVKTEYNEHEAAVSPLSAPPASAQTLSSSVGLEEKIYQNQHKIIDINQALSNVANPVRSKEEHVTLHCDNFKQLASKVNEYRTRVASVFAEAQKLLGLAVTEETLPDLLLLYFELEFEVSRLDRLVSMNTTSPVPMALSSLQVEVQNYQDSVKTAIESFKEFTSEKCDCEYEIAADREDFSTLNKIGSERRKLVMQEYKKSYTAAVR